MNASQVEYSFVAVGFVFATLAGYGVIPFGDESERSRRAKKTFRIVGPLGFICMALVVVLESVK